MRDRLPDGPPRSMDRQPHVFVGRDAEVAELLAGLQDAIGGRGRLFLVAGEPGIGKTTLAEELAARATDRGVRVLWGRCWEGGGAPAYWPWTQLLRPLMDNRGVPADSETARIATEVARLIPDFDEEAGGGWRLSAQSPVARFRFFAAVADLLRRASSVQPLLLILDDLHAADPASLLLLRFVARDLRDLPLLVIATYRESDVLRSADVAKALGELVREGPSLRLERLDLAEVQQLVAHLARAEASEEELSRIDKATGGNPLFVRELMSLAGPRGRESWRGLPAVSAGIRAVIHQRLAGLDEDSTHVLSVAAVAGQDFELHLIEQVLALELSAILESLARAEQAGLVTRVPGAFASFRFSHGLVKEVLYDDLSIPVRRELHGKVAAAIEALYGDDPASQLTRLAYHYGEIGTPEGSSRVVGYARRAGDQAMVSYAYEEAAAQYRHALEALRLAGPDDALRCELFLRLGGALARAGDYQEAKGSFLRAAEIARRIHAPEKLARAALGFGEPQVEGGLVDQQLLGLLQEALDWSNPDDSDLRARLLARLSMELTFSNEARLREEFRGRLSRQAMEMARRLGDPFALAIACRARWMALWGPDGLEERAGLSEEILRLARETGDREMELIGRARRITCSMESGDMGSLDADVAAHAGLAEDLHMPYHEWTAATLRAGRLLMEGSFGAAEKLIEAAPALLPGRPNARLAYLNQITLIRWEQGRLGELREEWRGVSERFPQAGFAGGWLVLADVESGQRGEAGRRLRAMAENLPDLSRSGLWLPTLATFSLAAGQVDDPDVAGALYPRLLPYAERAIAIPMPHPVTCFGSASLYLGLLATVMARWDEAMGHFESAIRANTRLGMAVFLARSQCEYARMLLRRGRASDHGRALALLDQAEATARALGMAAVGGELDGIRRLETATLHGVVEAEAAVLPASGRKNLFRREGEYRTVEYEGVVVRIRDSKGMRLLARLLAEPGREFHAIDLEREENRDAPAAPGHGRRPAPVELEERSDLGDAGEMLDPAAKAAYRERLSELESELEEAESWADSERAARARGERDFLVAELARAVGLGGRDRRAGSHAERARLNVTRAIKAALDNIDRNHSALGRHLRSTIRTGSYCSYTPDPRIPMDWQL